MANIKNISDGGADPNTPTIEQMRESQRQGSVGKGTQSEDYGQIEACFNMGTGRGGAEDKPTYPTQTNDENAEDLDCAGGGMVSGSQPWE